MVKEIIYGFVMCLIGFVIGYRRHKKEIERNYVIMSIDDMTNELSEKEKDQ